MGTRIRAWRERLKLNQAQLGERAGIGKGMISAIERGTDMPSVRVLAALGEALGCGVDALLGFAPRPAAARRLGLLEQRIEDLPEALREFVLISLALAERAKEHVPAQFLRPPTSENWAQFAAYLKALALVDARKKEAIE